MENRDKVLSLFFLYIKLFRVRDGWFCLLPDFFILRQKRTVFSVDTTVFYNYNQIIIGG